MKVLFAAFLCMLLCVITNAQNTSIKGIVIDKSNNEPLIGASVMINGSSKGALSDLDGNYEITDVAPGKYELICSYISYQEEKISIDIKNKVLPIVDFSLSYRTEVLSGVVIVAKQERQTVGALISLVQKSPAQVTGMSQDEIWRTPASQANDILKKISGTSIQDNKYVVVRGLADRYNTSLLNGIQLLSTEPDRRAFSFDLFPANLLDNLLVFKTANPDLPGEFAGGVIQLNTKEIPENSYIQLSVGSSYNTNSTGKPYTYTDVEKNDWIGLGIAARALPSEIDNTKKYKQNTDDPIKRYEQSTAFGNDWGLKNGINMAPSTSIQISGANKSKIGEKYLGLTYALNYSKLPRIINVDVLGYNTNDTIPFYAYNDIQNRQNINTAGLLNFTYELDPRNRISFNNVLTVNTENTVTNREGKNYEQARFEKANAVQYIANRMYVGQVQGNHNMDNMKIDWMIGYNQSSRDIPSLRRMFYTKNFEQQSESDTTFQAFVATGGASPNYAGRFYGTQNDNLFNLKLDVAKPYGKGEVKNTLKGGLFVIHSKRAFDARIFGYVLAKYNPALLFLDQSEIFDPENINKDGFFLKEATSAPDSYEGGTMMPGGYAMIDHNIAKWRFTGGIRLEYFGQTLDAIAYDLKPIEVNRTELSVLPSINIAYNINEKNKIRASASKTVSRPTFRELAPFAFYDFQYQRSLTGNPNLVSSSILNFDLRYECYPGKNQFFAVGGFYKNFTNPIENAVAATGGGALEFSYLNISGATNFGAEIEYNWKPFSILNFFGNLAYVNSAIDITGNTLGLKERPMQGQSPYVLNVGFNVNIEKTSSNITASFNRVGRRIWQVGFNGFNDIYEAPRNIIDLTLTQKLFKNMELKLSIADALNQRLVFYQDNDNSGAFNLNNSSVNRDNLLIGSVFGTNISATISYKFQK